MKNKPLIIISSIIACLVIGFGIQINNVRLNNLALKEKQDKYAATLKTEALEKEQAILDNKTETLTNTTVVAQNITTEKTQPTTPQTQVVTDAKGNQVITPNVVVPNPNGVTPKPGTETPKVESKPVETPAPTEQPKTEDKPTTNKPASNAAKDGDRRVANGQKEIFLEGFGWLEDAPGGSSETADFELSGNIIGH